MKLTPEQQQAYNFLSESLSNQNIKYIGLWGYAGTGKSTVIQEFLKNEIDQNIYTNHYGKVVRSTVAQLAPTNKAVKVLMDKGKTAGNDKCVYQTVHSALEMRKSIDSEGNRSFKVDNGSTLDRGLARFQIIVIDEVSMVGSDLWGDVRSVCDDLPVKVICMGDRAQLPPVNEESGESPVFNDVDVSFELTSPVRYEGSLADFAFELRSNLDAENHNLIYDFLDKSDDTIQFQSYNKWLDSYLSLVEQETDVKAVAWTNAAVAELNRMARSVCFEDTTNCFQKGDQLMNKEPIVQMDSIILSGRSELTVRRAEKIQLKLPESIAKLGELTVWELLLADNDSQRVVPMLALDMDDPDPNFVKAKKLLGSFARAEKDSNKRKEKWREYYKFIESFCDAQYNYAITAHSAQGSTYENTFILYQNMMKNKCVNERNKLLYTAITRSSKTAILGL